MQQKRLALTETQLDDLLKIVEETSKEEEGVVLLEDDLFSFLQSFNIKQGNELVLKSVLYSLYKSWSEFPLNRPTFAKRIARYFSSHKKSKAFFYKVNRSSFDLSTELLKYLEKNQKNKTKSPTWKRHFEDFLNSYGIESGKTWVESTIIKHLYDKWCYNSRRKVLLSDHQLLGFLRLYFKQKRNGSSRIQWFALNKEFTDKHITKEMIENLNQRRKTTNEKKQKTKNKIPSTKART